MSQADQVTDLRLSVLLLIEPVTASPIWQQEDHPASILWETGVLSLAVLLAGLVSEVLTVSQTVSQVLSSETV